MKTVTLTPLHVTPFSSNTKRFLATLLVLEAILSFLPLLILGPAIGWPASLRNAPSAQLTAIFTQASAVQLGYAVYLLYSIVIAPAALIVVVRIARTPLPDGTAGTDSPLLKLAVIFAALSALTRSLGILRWLTVMPLLAVAYADPNAANRASIELTFSAFNAYGGGIGELLGVALFGGLWLLLAMVAALKRAAIPRWLCAFGIVSALLQMSLFLPAIGVSVHVPVAVAVTSFAVWLVVFAIQWGFTKQTSA